MGTIFLAFTYVITYARVELFQVLTHMDAISVTDARAKYRLIDEAAAAHEPILITGQRNNAEMI